MPTIAIFAGSQLLDLDLAIDGVDPAALPPLIPELAQLRHVAAPVSGTAADADRPRTRRRPEGRGSISAWAPARLHSDWLPTGSVAIDERRAACDLCAGSATSCDSSGSRSISAAGPELGVDGKLGRRHARSVRAPAGMPVRRAMSAASSLTQLTHLPVARLGRSVAGRVQPRGRRWVAANIHDGMLDEAAVQLALDLDPASAHRRHPNATGHAALSRPDHQLLQRAAAGAQGQRHRRLSPTCDSISRRPAARSRGSR